jgi:phosphatidylserine/phosphatidylglycerophosphate/cardiolipin synthase-like enzyme
MKKALLICTLALLLSHVASCADAPPGPPPPSTQPTIDVLFSPRGGCTARIVDEIGKAKKTIRIQAYSFTSAPIAKAVVDAKKRGVDCEVILDKSQAKQTYSEADFFHNQDVPTLIDDRHAIAHNKIILIDGATVITGSFNFTKAAEESNAENLLVIKGDADLAAKYAKNYAEHRSHSRKYEGRKATVGGGR